MNAPHPLQTKDLYEQITDSIIKALENGTAPWQRPWTEVASMGRMKNAISGGNYHGINSLLLYCTALDRNYQDSRWLTFRQASENCWKVKKGEHGTRIAYFQPLQIADGEKRDPSTGAPVMKTIPMLKTYVVFNVGQLENGPPPLTPEVKESWQAEEAAEKVIADLGITIRHGGNKAYYTPAGDYCQIPPKGSFPTYADYLGTVLHELSHATMHPSRLDRKEGAAGQFGSEAYAKEELRAELASMFLSSELGVPGSTDNHAAYIESWLAALRKDKREIFRAAAEAQRIAEFVMGRKPEMRQKKDAQPMTPEGQAWADDYSRAESEEQGRQGFAARPSNQRPKSKWQPEAGFVVPTAPPAHQPAMGSDGLSGPN